MKLTLVLLAVIGFNAVLTNAFHDECDRCDFFIAGSGFLQTPYCRAYIRCEEHNDGIDYGTRMCCRPDWYWDQYRLTCMPDIPSWESCTPTSGEPADYCPDIPTIYNDTCGLAAHSTDVTKYISLKFNTVMSCAPGTVFDAAQCICDFGYNPQPDCDPIIHFDFTDDYNSRSCKNFVKGMSHGDVQLVNGKACFGGINGFITFNFLNNYFIDNPVAKGFSLSAWVEADASLASLGAIVSNGNCHEVASFLMAVDPVGAEAGIRTVTDGFVTANTPGSFLGSWMFYVITYDGKKVKTYIDSALVDTRTTSGALYNVQTASAIGIYEESGVVNNFFKGCIDDVSFFKSVLDPTAINTMYAAGPSP